MLVVLALPWARTAQATVVDILIVYETGAASWVGSNGGMEGFAQDAVNRMNQAAQNTGLDLSFRLVHHMAVSYSAVSLDKDLIALQAGSGVFADVASARDTYGADLVAMLIDTGSAYGYTGLGYLLANWSGHADYAHTVTSIRAVAIGNTMTHEVGHNLGADHSKYQASGPGPNTYLDGQYSAGWYFAGTDGKDYHTIMAYDSDGFGGYYDPAPLFSTPSKTYQGTPAGDASDGDNARLIGQTKDIIAGYRASVQTAPTAPIAMSAAEVAQTGFTAMWSSADGAEGYALDVSESADFVDFVSGFAQLDVGTATSQAITGLSLDTDYFYRVRAYNGQGVSEYSNVVSVTTAAVDRDSLWRVTEIYIATMGYAPDNQGLQYWVDQIEAGRGWTPTTVAQSFFDQPLVREKYPETQGFGPLIEALYQNIFGRSADAEGYAYWLDELESGRVARNQMIIALINGGWANPDAAQDMARFGNQVEVALAFADYQADNGIVYGDLSEDDQALLRQIGRDVIADVTYEATTRDAAIASIPSLFASLTGS
ncbi:DUF4214 domain-containing protein [Thiorhodococcus minor]|uniref:DUF4214 domain-containing protein n=1 Tax=Thiorhodococcus minor TaxID=57489 RepID=A0A6M0JUA8_9GAMM|nr:DUF4214 domain-containing protein [Thiorhodococcus minor]NEV61116.1 DUF4214 domain-containing protein [Thiorhodococcus minor]